MNSRKDDLKSKSVIIILVIVIVAIIIAGYLFSTVFYSSIKKQLELGQKYLNEEDWEQALVAFDEEILILARQRRTLARQMQSRQ